jgi:hypothetical protein
MVGKVEGDELHWTCREHAGDEEEEERGKKELALKVKGLLLDGKKLVQD